MLPEDTFLLTSKHTHAHTWEQVASTPTNIDRFDTSCEGAERPFMFGPYDALDCKNGC